MAGTDDERAPGGAPGNGERLPLEEFIFVRELYEVFLLLDHISGSWDKDLREETGADPALIIRTICEIGLTPAADPELRLAQAVALMRAKEMLNAVAAGESKGLLDAWALSGSALSFIAGYGVESVFQALENFVQRLFRTDEPKRRG